jgi:hypothetical protein
MPKPNFAKFGFCVLYQRITCNSKKSDYFLVLFFLRTVKTDYSLLKKHHATAGKMPHLCTDESNTLVWFDFWSCFCSGAGYSAPEWFLYPPNFYPSV